MAKPGDRLVVADGSLGKKAETMTVEEFLSKPDRGVNRRELAAFISTIMVNDVATLIRLALRENNKEWEKRMHAAIKDALEAKAKARPALWTPDS